MELGFGTVWGMRDLANDCLAQQRTKVGNREQRLRLHYCFGKDPCWCTGKSFRLEAFFLEAERPLPRVDFPSSCRGRTAAVRASTEQRNQQNSGTAASAPGTTSTKRLWQHSLLAHFVDPFGAAAMPGRPRATRRQWANSGHLLGEKNEAKSPRRIIFFYNASDT